MERVIGRTFGDETTTLNTKGTKGTEDHKEVDCGVSVPVLRVGEVEVCIFICGGGKVPSRGR